MGRTRLAKATLSELNQRLDVSKKRKQQFEIYLQKLKTRYHVGEISYYEFTETVYLKRDGRTIQEWIEFYKQYIQNCEIQIKRQNRILIKQKIQTFFFAFVFILLLSSVFFLNPQFIGFVVQEQAQEFSQDLNLNFNQSTTYNWQLENSGQLNSVKLSGLIKGIGNVKIYFDDLLILDNSQTISPITGQVIETPEQDSINFFQKFFGFFGLVGRVVEDTNQSYSEKPEEGVSPNEESSPSLGQDENLELPSEQLGNDQTPSSSENQTQEIREEIITEFSEICEDTCDLSQLNLNKSSYELKIEISNAELQIDKIIYEIFAKEVIEEVVENITEFIEQVENITVPGIVTTANATINTTQYQAVINQPVKWKKHVQLDKPEIIKINLPKQAENIIVNKISKSNSEAKQKEEVSLQEESSPSQNETSSFSETKNKTKAKFSLTGKVITTEPAQERGFFKSFSNFFKNIFSRITGRAIDVQEQEELIEVTIDDNAEEYEIEYETPAPYVVESPIWDTQGGHENLQAGDPGGPKKAKKGKRVKLSGPEKIIYEDVLTFTELDETLNIKIPLRVKVKWVEQNIYIPVQKIEDKDNNGIYDYIEWISPSSDNQTYEIIIEIIKAEHLDENREFISDIYNEVYELDDIWSEAIPDTHFIRATFEIPLDSSRDITLYPRVVNGTPRIQVYEIDGTEVIAEFTTINSNEYNTVYLTNLFGTQDTFDLRVVGGSLEFDYIVDPVLILRPDSPGDLTQWDLGAGVLNYEAVDEIGPHDSDTTYVTQESTSDEDDLYNINTNDSLTGVMINNVTVYAIAKSIKTGTGSVSAQPLYILIKSGGVIYPDAGRNPATSYTTYSNTWSLNPDGNVAWTKSAIDDLQIGIRGRTGTGGRDGRHTQWVTQLYVIVDYSEAVDNPLTIFLESPVNNTIITNDSTPVFKFNVTDDISATLNCDLIINGTKYGNNASVLNGTSTGIIANDTLRNGDYWWSVNCSDGVNWGSSDKRNISMQALPVFVNESNNFSLIYGEWLEVEVGNFSSESFKPSIKIKKWDNEVWLKVSLPTEEIILPNKTGNTIRWQEDGREVLFYPLDENNFEFEIVLNTKPASNIISLTLDSQSLDFFYQPALNASSEENCDETSCWDGEEIINYRPENVIGSYALYHSTKSNIFQTSEDAEKYKTGKAIHIYRPKIVDSNGWEVWGELNITGGKMNITIPQNFIDDAVYPIYHATGATFGFEGQGGSYVSTLNVIKGSNFTGGSGEGVNITAYWTSTGSGPSRTGKHALYEGDNDFVQETDTRTDATGWQTLNFLSQPTLTPIEYTIVSWSNSGSGSKTINLNYDTVAGSNQGRTDSATYGTFPDPLVPTNTDFKHSIYVSYTPSGGPANNAPTTPLLNAPANSTRINTTAMANLNIPMNWSNSSDEDGDSITYVLQVWNDSALTQLMHVNNSITETTNTTGAIVTFPNVSSDDFFWRVLSTDGEDNSSWSLVRNISLFYDVVGITYGTLNVSIQKPDDNSDWVYGNTSLTINATVTCEGEAGALCGTVYANARYNLTGSPDTAVNITSGGLPFYSYLSRGGIFENITDGFDIEVAGVYVPQGITFDTRDNSFWVVDSDDKFVYHFNSSGDNQTDGFSTLSAGADYPNGIAFDSTDNSFWVVDYLDDFVYHFNSEGVNQTDGFDVGGAGADTPYSIAFDPRDNSFWITDYDDEFVYHFNSAGDNQTDGFSTLIAGVDAPYAIAFDPRDNSFWVIDYWEVFVSHVRKGNPQQISQTLEQGESWNISWILNVTSEDTESYLLDVLFNSSYGNSLVPDNDTEDRQVNLNTPIYGTLNVNITSPINESTFLYGNNNLTINATVSCEGEDGAVCGTVEALARYNLTGSPDTAVNVTEGGEPFYVSSGAPDEDTVYWRPVSFEPSGIYGDLGKTVDKRYNDTTTAGYLGGIAGDGTIISTYNLSNTIEYATIVINIRYDGIDSVGNFVSIYNYTSGEFEYWINPGDIPSSLTLYSKDISEGYISTLGQVKLNVSGASFGGPNVYLYDTHITTTGGGTYDYWGITNPSNTHNSSFYTSDDACSSKHCGTEINDAGYRSINQSDDSYLLHSQGASYVGLSFFHFLIDETTSSIDEVQIRYEGYESYAGTSYLQYWNTTSGGYETYDQVPTSDNGLGVVLKLNTDDAISDVVDSSGYINIRILQSGGVGGLYTDYIKVNVLSGGSSSNPKSQFLSQGESWNMSWILNVTSGDVESYLIDVLFNSSYGGSVPDNDTEDRQVNLNVEGEANTPPEIIWVFNDSMTDVSGQLNEGPSATSVIINFTASDAEGYETLNDATAYINFTKTDEDTRINSTCSRISGSGNLANYTCNVTMWWWDAPGTWDISAYILDDEAEGATNTSTNFQVGSFAGFYAGPISLTWDSITSGATDKLSNNTPIVLNNSGNLDRSIDVNATNLRGDITPSYGLWAGNFSLNIANACEGTAMVEASFEAISGASLTTGNYTANGAEGREELYVCLEVAGVELIAQDYSTTAEGSWTIRIFLVVLSLRRRKKGKIKQLSVPILLFSGKIGPLESLVKYLKENLNMKYHEIAKILNRDERTIWASYSKAIEKQKEFFKTKKTEMMIPVQIFENRKLTVLEAVVVFLKEKQMRYSEIAELLNKDQRNIWTIYSRVIKKITKKEIIELTETKQELCIPITIFSKKLGALEAIIKYMKENLGMNYRTIAKQLERDERTIWTAYKKSHEKQKQFLKIKPTQINLPISRLNNRNLTILEAVIICLKQQGIKYSEMSKIINRDQRNIWTVYSRAEKKINN